MPPSQPRRSSIGQRQPVRARKSGTPPVILILIVAVPLLGIGVFAYRQYLHNREPIEASQPVEADPNAEIKELDNQLHLIQEEAKKAYRLGIESPQFKLRAQGVINQLNGWMDRFDRIFSAVKGPDGEWPAEYQGYSRKKAEAGMLKNDLIRQAGF